MSWGLGIPCSGLSPGGVKGLAPPAVTEVPWPSLEAETNVRVVFATPSTLWLFRGKGPHLVTPHPAPASYPLKSSGLSRPPQWLQAHCEKVWVPGRWWATG